MDGSWHHTTIRAFYPPRMTSPHLPKIDSHARAQHLRWLHEVTPLPTVAGKEHRVIRWIMDWAEARPELTVATDPSGNLVIRFAKEPTPTARPVYFTAHLDHPAFVIDKVHESQGDTTRATLAFRGGVMEEYFAQTAVVLCTDVTVGDHRVPATIVATDFSTKPFETIEVEFKSNEPGAPHLRPGDVGVWSLPAPSIVSAEESGGVETFHTLACDDLSALVAAICAMDVLLHLRRAGQETLDVRLLFTRAEEIGFIGAIAAVKHGTIEREARVIALENSRSFPDSPIGGGPIVRVGDRISVFSPSLTDAVAKRAEEIAGGPSTVTAKEKLSDLPQWKWQRKLMAGGACEASVFCHAGYEATCVCLPLGNYHNMADLARVQERKNDTRPLIAREYIGVKDFEGLVDLLVACGLKLGEGGGMGQRIEKLWTERSFVLNADPA